MNRALFLELEWLMLLLHRLWADKHITDHEYVKAKETLAQWPTTPTHQPAQEAKTQ